MSQCLSPASNAFSNEVVEPERWYFFGCLISMIIALFSRRNALLSVISSFQQTISRIYRVRPSISWFLLMNRSQTSVYAWKLQFHSKSGSNFVWIQQINALVTWWKCNKACLNKSGHWYVMDGVHFRLFAQNFKTWSMAINDDNADVETCPEELAKTLQFINNAFTKYNRKSASKIV